jgi:hypothetical protein
MFGNRVVLMEDEGEGMGAGYLRASGWGKQEEEEERGRISAGDLQAGR